MILVLLPFPSTGIAPFVSLHIFLGVYLPLKSVFSLTMCCSAALGNVLSKYDHSWKASFHICLV